MRVVVVLRLVPDLTEELEIDESGTDIDREWIGIKLNEFDDHALEEAVLLKEGAGATVTALALDGEGVDRMLQSAIARGADAAVKVEHGLEHVPDQRTAAAILAGAIAELGADLILTGVQTPEDVFGQLAPFLAAHLDMPTVNAVGGVSADGEAAVDVRQEYSGGMSAILGVTLPAVLGIQTASQPPRYVSGSKLRQAMSAEIRTITGADAGSATGAEITGLQEPERGDGATMFEGDAQAVAGKIVDVLNERGLLGG